MIKKAHAIVLSRREEIMKNRFNAFISLLMTISLAGCGSSSATSAVSSPSVASTVQTEASSAAITDMDADVLVVGSGLAGLQAAAAAAESGEQVLLIEKMGVLGGTSATSGGGIGAPGSRVQKAYGIEDSAEAYVNLQDEYTREVIDDDSELPDRDRRLFIINQAPAVIDRLLSYGYEFGRPTSFGLIEGVDRFHYPTNLENGQVGKMAEIAEDAGAIILTNTKADSLITDKNGTVIGVEAEDKDGNNFTINAKAVILATGGFARSEALINELCPETKGTYTVAGAGSTGDGITMAREIGAALYEHQWQMGMSYTTTNEDGNTLASLGGPWSIHMMVDKDGVRFMNEFKHPTAYTNMVDRNAGPYFQVYDSSDPDQVAIFEDSVNANSSSLITADTIQELADKAGMDAEQLQKWVDDWNTGIDKGKDTYGARIDYMAKIETAPFHLVKVTPQSMDTEGGIVTNENAQVIKEDNTPIVGLYAAGAVSNGALYTKAYMSGTSVLNCYVMGYIAGKNAADFANGGEGIGATNDTDAPVLPDDFNVIPPSASPAAE